MGAVILLGLLMSGQFHKQKVDWKPCEDAMHEMKDSADKFNDSHKDGPKVQVSCSYGGNPQIPKLPERHVALTLKEISTLNELRNSSSQAYETEAAYEEYLIKVHRVKSLEVGDPCWFFVGIKVQDDFITVDPNPFDPECAVQ